MTTGSTVLFDAPGPATRRRHLLYSGLFLLVFAGILAWVFVRLNDAGQLEAEIFEKLFQENILSAILDGLANTLKAAVLAIVLAVLFGFLLATGRLSERAYVRWPATAVIEFFRAVPLLLLIIFIFAMLGGRGLETQARGLMALVGGLMLYNGAVLAEVFRAGVNAVPKGQAEAAYAIGMRKTQVLMIIQMPQAIRYMLPAIISQCVVALKDTSLGFAAAYLELLRQGRLIAEYVGNNLWTYVMIALIYIVLNSIVSTIATMLEKRLRTSGAGKAVEATEEAVPQG